MRNAATWNFETLNLPSLPGVCGMHIRIQSLTGKHDSRQDVPFGRLLSALSFSKNSIHQLPAAHENNNGQEGKTASQQTRS